MVDAESSHAFHAKLSGAKGAALEVGTELPESEFCELLEPQLARISSAEINPPRVNL